MESNTQISNIQREIINLIISNKTEPKFRCEYGFTHDDIVRVSATLAAYLKSPPPKNNSEDVYRWVKASERLPEKEGYYNCKFWGEPEKIGYHNKRFMLGHDTPVTNIDRLEWLEKIPINTEGEYWKKRCEAAEKLISSFNHKAEVNFEVLNEWKQLKNNEESEKQGNK